MADQQNQSYAGQQGLTDQSSFSSIVEFHVRQVLAESRTTMPVKVIAVHGGGGGAPGTVDVQPLVSQADGKGVATPHGVIYGIPFSRNQGGKSAIINDPVVGDIGMMHVHDRDISALKTSPDGKLVPPGSFRRFSPADGTYSHAMLNPATPAQYIHFNDKDGGMTLQDKFGNKIVTAEGGITIQDKSGNKIVSDSNGWHFTSPKVTNTGDMIAGQDGGDQVSLQNHLHIDAGGAGDSGKPKAGT